MIEFEPLQFCNLAGAPRLGPLSTAIHRMRGLFASTCGCVLLAACGPAANSPDVASPPIAAKPDVVVTIDGQHHSCLVALSNEAQGSSIACDEVVPFVRDELRVPSGGIYDIRTIPEADKAQVANVEAGLKGAGYRFIGGPHPKSN